MNKFYLKIFLTANIFLFIVFLLLPIIVNAADKLTPGEFRRMCWTEEECMKDSKGNKTLGNTDEAGCSDKYCWKQGKDGCKDKFGRCYVKPSAITLQVSIPGPPGDDLLNKSINTEDDNRSITDRTADVTGFPTYLKVLYSYFISIIGIVAVTMIAYGGYEWLMAAGSAEKISKAKNTIQGAMIGLLLGLGSYVILNTINKDLVNINNFEVERIKPMVLASACDNDAFKGIDDWVLEADQANNTSGKQRCGSSYISKADDSISCIGRDCSYSGSSGKYCLKEEVGWKCVSAEEMKKDCNKIIGNDLKINPNLCEDKDKEWAKKYKELPLTCKLDGNWRNDLVNNDIGWKLFNFILPVNTTINLIKGLPDNEVYCLAYPLVNKPADTTRLKCYGNAPGCWSTEQKYGYHGCSDPPIRIGKGYNSMCIESEKCISNNEVTDCSNFNMRDGCVTRFEPNKCGDINPWEVFGLTE